MISATTRKIRNLSFLQLSLSSPETGNCFGSKEGQELRIHLKSFKHDGLLVTNQGTRFFSTGGNLKEQKNSTRATSLKIQKNIRKAFSLLAELPVPKVAVVKGDAFGGGVEFLSCFDYVIACPHVQIGFWQRRLGVTFGWGGGSRLLRRWSEQKLMSSVLSARVFSSYEAERLGLVDEVVPLSLAEKKAWQWLVRSGELPKESLKALQKWNAKNEVKTFESLWFKKDHLAALKNF